MFKPTVFKRVWTHFYAKIIADKNKKADKEKGSKLLKLHRWRWTHALNVGGNYAKKYNGNLARSRQFKGIKRYNDCQNWNYRVYD